MELPPKYKLLLNSERAVDVLNLCVFDGAYFTDLRSALKYSKLNHWKSAELIVRHCP